MTWCGRPPRGGRHFYPSSFFGAWITLRLCYLILLNVLYAKVQKHQKESVSFQSPKIILGWSHFRYGQLPSPCLATTLESAKKQTRFCNIYLCFTIVALTNYFTPGRCAKYCDQRVCVSIAHRGVVYCLRLPCWCLPVAACHQVVPYCCCMCTLPIVGFVRGAVLCYGVFWYDHAMANCRKLWVLSVVVWAC